MRNKAVWIVLGVVVVAIIAIVAVQQTRQPKEEKVIKIGAILPLTGDLAFIGEQARNNIELSIANGGIKNVRFIYEDSMSDPKVARNAIAKLMATGVNCVLSTPSNISEVVDAAIVGQRTPHFICSFDPDLPQKSTYNIRYFVSSKGSAEKFYEYIVRNRYDKVVFLRPNLSYAEKAIGTIASRLKARGVDIIDIPYPINTSDFRSILIKLRSVDPDLVVIQGFAFSVVRIVRQSKELKITIPMLGDMDFLEIEDTADRELVEGIPFVAVEYVFSEKYKAWRDSYFKRYGKEPLPFGPFYYDVPLIISQAFTQTVQKTGRWDADLFVQTLQAREHNYTVGSVRFDGNREVILQYTFATYRQGEVVRW